MEQRLNALIGKTFYNQNKYAFTKLKEYDITPGQPKLLEYLSDHEGCSKKQITDDLHTDTATVTNVLANMENGGLIERHLNQETGDSGAYYLTNKGRKAHMMSRKVFRELEDNCFQGIDEAEKEHFMLLLNKIYRNITEMEA